MKKYIAVILTLALGLSALAGCSTKLAPETLPSEVPTNPTESTVILPSESETETTETEPMHGPNSTAVVTDRIVDLNGQLAVDGTNIVNSEGEAIQLKGMSTYALNMCPDTVNEEFVKTLAEDWGIGLKKTAKAQIQPSRMRFFFMTACLPYKRQKFRQLQRPPVPRLFFERCPPWPRRTFHCLFCCCRP